MSMQMATVEVNPGCNEGEQKEKMSPPDEDSPPVLNDATAPLNFSDLTLCQFGISVQSFTPASSANRKGERNRPFYDAELVSHLHVLPQICVLHFQIECMMVLNHNDGHKDNHGSKRCIKSEAITSEGRFVFTRHGTIQVLLKGYSAPSCSR